MAKFCCTKHCLFGRNFLISAKKTTSKLHMFSSEHRKLEKKLHKDTFGTNSLLLSGSLNTETTFREMCASGVIQRTQPPKEKANLKGKTATVEHAIN